MKGPRPNVQMTSFCRLIGLVLVATVLVHAGPAISESPTRIRPAKVEITGRGFEIHVMRNKTLAFSSRNYVWSDVPASIDGLRYTRTDGGGTATIHLKAKENGEVFVAVVANSMLDLRELGWTLPVPDRANTFTYSDQARSLMVIMSQKVTAGQQLDIPQLGFSGTIVLLPTEPESGEPKVFKL